MNFPKDNNFAIQQNLSLFVACIIIITKQNLPFLLLFLFKVAIGQWILSLQFVLHNALAFVTYFPLKRTIRSKTLTRSGSLSWYWNGFGTIGESVHVK